MTPTTLSLMSDPKTGWTLSVSGARRAAERAMRAATVSFEWANREGVGMELGMAALAAAEQAMQAAERASIATTLETIREEAALAWAAADRTIEIDRRLTTTIAEMMWVTDMDRSNEDPSISA
ncbi:MAG: hypothetical protein ACKOC6_09295 [bacterium]